MVDFLFHDVSEKEKKEIEKQAKQIMDNFSKKLEKVSDKLSEPVIQRNKSEREEGEVDDSSFDRDIMFENASEKNKDFIIAERGDW